MGSHNPPIIIQGAYSEHFQGLQKNGIEILKQDSFYERGNIIHKIRKLQQETQKRRKDQQLRREMEEKKEEERRKQILEERRRHLQEVTEKYQRLGRKRFRLLTATTSPLLSRAETVLEDSMTSALRDGTTSTLPISHTSRIDLNSRGNSADVMSRMQEHGLPVTSNGANFAPTNETILLNGESEPIHSETTSSYNRCNSAPPSPVRLFFLKTSSDDGRYSGYKKASNNPAMLSALNPPGTAQIGLNNGNNTSTSALSAYSAQFQAVRANHQRLLEQLGIKSNETPPPVNGNTSNGGLSATGTRIYIDATNGKSAVQQGQQINSRPPSGVQPQKAENGATNGSVVTGLPTVVATAATVQEAMQASYSLNSRATALKPLSSQPQSLQQSVLFLQSNGVISGGITVPAGKPPSATSSAQSNNNATNGNSNSSHQFGTIIHMQQQQPPAVPPPPQFKPEPPPLPPQQDLQPPALKLTSIETTPVVRPQPPVVTVVPPPPPVVPQAPKERPIGLVRPSSATNVKRDESVVFGDSLSVDSHQSSTTSENKKPEMIHQQLGSIKLMQQQDEFSAEKQQQVFLTSVPAVPDIVRVFNATAPDGATLMAQVNDLKVASSTPSSKGSSPISLNFQIPSGVMTANAKQFDESSFENDAFVPQQAPPKIQISINNKPNVAFTQPSIADFQSAGKPPLSATANRPPSGKIPPETAYTEITRPVNQNNHLGVSLIKRYNSDSALADQQQGGHEQMTSGQQLITLQRAETAPEPNESSGHLGRTSGTPLSNSKAIKSILKRSPSLERANLGSAGHSRTAASPSVQFNTMQPVSQQQQQQQQQPGGPKSVTFGQVHIADLTAEGPIAVRDSIELTKFRQIPDEKFQQRRKVLFTVEDNDDDQKLHQPPSQVQGSSMKNSSNSQIIRVEMGGRSTPRNPPNSPSSVVQRGSGYANLVPQRNAPSTTSGRPNPAGNQPQQQQPQLISNITTDSAPTSQPVAVEHAPSDAEINWLWEKVRSCLNRSQSATAARPQLAGQPSMTPNSLSAVPRIGSAPLNNSTGRGGGPQGSHKLYIDGSGISPATGAQLYVANGSNNGNSAFNAVHSHPVRAPAVSNTSPLKALIATGVNVNPPAMRPAIGNSNHGRTDEVSQSTMAFIAAEQLVAGGLSESIIHDAIDQIQAQNRQPQIQMQAAPQQYQTPSGNGRSALSLEEEQIMKSLDRMNDRLQYLEVTGQSAAVNKASPNVNSNINNNNNNMVGATGGDVIPLQPALAYTNYYLRR